MLSNLMGSNTDVVELPYYCTIKVHRLICLQLKGFIDRISQIFSDIESARPCCGKGIQAVSLLHHAVDKAKFLIQNCSDSSKLYLAIIADKIVLRCERICNILRTSLSQLQNNVPTLLAAKISGIVEDLKSVKFTVESADDEAGSIVLALIRQGMNGSEPINISELEAIQIAASKLNIVSRTALLIEKRSIKKLIERVPERDVKKIKILKYLLYLVRKYEELKRQDTPSTTMHQSIEHGSHEESSVYETLCDDIGVTKPPEELTCPISMRLMYDPVVIASGQTYERFWINKWFNDGNETCPKTHAKLSHFILIPNTMVKNLIARWCLEHGHSIPNPCSQQAPASIRLENIMSSSSISSLGSSMNGLCLQTSMVSLHSTDTNFPSNKLDAKTNNGSVLKLPRMNADSQGCQPSANRHGMNFAFLSQLAALPWESQCQAIGNLKDQLEDSEASCSTFSFSSSYIKPLIRFLKDARENCNLQAQQDGARVLLTFLNKHRSEMPPLHEDAICLLASFLDSEIAGEALAIVEVLSCQHDYKTEILASCVLHSILKLLDTKSKKYHMLILKILCNLSTNYLIGQHIIYLEGIPRLAPFLVDGRLAGYCIKILRNLCDIEEAKVTVAETDQCINFIAEILENGSREEQVDALEVVCSVCHSRQEYIPLFRKDDIVQSLFHISLNGNDRGQSIAKESLRLLRNTNNNPIPECSSSTSGLGLQDLDYNFERKKQPSKASRILVKRIFEFHRTR